MHNDHNHVMMEEDPSRRGLRKLISKLVGLGKSDYRLSHKASPDCSQPDLNRSAVNMAEQEEDFSSLPLPDRFAHKVNITLHFFQW